MIPSQKQIDQSKLFQERPSDKNAPVADVSNAWIPILEDRLWLAAEAPDRIKHKDGTAPLYKYKDLLKLVPSTAGAWTAKNAKPALIAVIPPTTTTPLETTIGVEGLHTMAALCKVTIPKLPGTLGRRPSSIPFVVTVESGSRISRRTSTTYSTTSALSYSVEVVMGRPSLRTSR